MDEIETRTATAARLRRAIARRGGSPRTPLSTELRAQAIAFAGRRAAAGATQAAIARELGVSQVSVGRWLGASRMTAMVPVRVATEPAAGATGFVVTTPRGLRIESLDVDALCTLVVSCG